MTPEEASRRIDTMLAENGLQLSVSVVDVRNGLNIAQALSEQWGYVLQVKIVERDEPINTNNTPRTQPAN